jgi:hypothetical protein
MRVECRMGPRGATVDADTQQSPTRPVPSLEAVVLEVFVGPQFSLRGSQVLLAAVLELILGKWSLAPADMHGAWRRQVMRRPASIAETFAAALEPATGRARRTLSRKRRGFPGGSPRHTRGGRWCP